MSYAFIKKINAIFKDVLERLEGEGGAANHVHVLDSYQIEL